MDESNPSGIFFLLLLVALYFFFRRPREKPLLSSSAKSIGERGETLIYSVLRPLEKHGFKFLSNLYVPSGNDRRETTEIDLVMIGLCGVFIIESKNYSGWIFGNERNRYWTQVLYHEKHRFYNPIRQNHSHIRWLKKYVGYKTPVYSLIVFSDHCTFKDITYESPEVSIIHRNELKNTVSRIIQNASIPWISEVQVQEIFVNLSQFLNVPEATKLKHIKDVKSEQNA